MTDVLNLYLEFFENGGNSGLLCIHWCWFLNKSEDNFIPKLCELKQRVRDQYYQEWFSTCILSSKINLYKLCKRSRCYESYISSVPVPKYRSSPYHISSFFLKRVVMYLLSEILDYVNVVIFIISKTNIIFFLFVLLITGNLCVKYLPTYTIYSPTVTESYVYYLTR